MKNIPTPIEVSQDAETSAINDKGEWLRWYYRLGHLSYPKMKILMILSILPRRLLDTRSPSCACCNIRRITKQPRRVKGKFNKGKLRTSKRPGDCVSVDHMEYHTPEFIGILRGFITKRRYTCAAIFTDPFSDMSYVYLQYSFTVEDTIKVKVAFEAYARSQGVKIKQYHADNGRFANRKFLEAIENEDQTISFCAAYAHHQNGKAEKRFRDLQDQTRKLLLHSISRWPKASSVHLWPYALVYANEIRNNLPVNTSGMSPLETFTKTDVQPRFKTFRTFGCPAYTLNRILQSGKSIQKWDPRCYVGLYLGISPRHARSVSLVLNLQSGRISPQFHVKYDEFFETIDSRDQDIVKWKRIVGLCNYLKHPPLPTIPAADVVRKKVQLPPPILENTNVETPPLEEETVMNADPFLEDKPLEGDPTMDIAPSSPTTPLRRSMRVKKPSRRLLDSIDLQDLNFDPVGPHTISFSSYFEALHQDDYKFQDDIVDPIAFQATLDKDTLYYHQAMKADDSQQFKKAMKTELDAHSHRKHWEVIYLDDIPEGEKVLDYVWTMRRKINILTNEVYKHKTRLNIHGGQQEFAINFFDTYSPVVIWFAIRILLIYAVIFK